MSESIQSNILCRITPTVLQIELSQDKVYKDILKTKPIKATGAEMGHSPIRQSFKLEFNFSTVGKSFLNLVKL